MTNIRSPWQGGALWPNPDKDKVHWAIRCDYCYEVIIHWKDNREDLNEMEIIRYGQQEIEDERGRIIVFSPAGNSSLFPDVYHLRNDKRALCKDCYEIAIHRSVD